MEIKIGDYTIRSDAYCCWIDRDSVQAKGKNIGKVTTKRVTGYFGKFEHLLMNFTEKSYKDADAQTVEDALDEIAKAEKETLRIAREAGKQLDERKKS